MGDPGLNLFCPHGIPVTCHMSLKAVPFIPIIYWSWLKRQVMMIDTKEKPLLDWSIEYLNMTSIWEVFHVAQC